MHKNALITFPLFPNKNATALKKPKKSSLHHEKPRIDPRYDVINQKSYVSYHLLNRASIILHLIDQCVDQNWGFRHSSTPLDEFHCSCDMMRNISHIILYEWGLWCLITWMWVLSKSMWLSCHYAQSLHNFQFFCVLYFILC